MLAPLAAVGLGVISNMVRYVVRLSALPAAATLLLYPVTVWPSGLSLRRFASGIWPTQLLAFSSRSSVACLPMMLERAHGASPSRADACRRQDASSVISPENLSISTINQRLLNKSETVSEG